MDTFRRDDLEVAKAHLTREIKIRDPLGVDQLQSRRLLRAGDELGLKNNSQLLWAMAKTELELERRMGRPWPSVNFDIKPTGRRWFKYEIIFLFGQEYQPRLGASTATKRVWSMSHENIKRIVRHWSMKYERHMERAHNAERVMYGLEPTTYPWREHYEPFS